jgi:hypothetical protein
LRTDVSVEEDIWTKREEDGSWRKSYNDEIHGLYSSPNIIRAIKSRRMRGETCGTHGGGERCLQGFGWEARREETTRNN